MVLGVDFMRKMGPTTFDFENQKVQFTRGGKEIILQGINAEPTFRMITGKQLKLALRKGRGTLFG